MGDLRKNASGLFETVIDGATYEFSKWGAEKATDVLLDLTSLVGKPMGIAAQMAVKANDPDAAATQGDLMGQILEHLTSAVGEKKQLCLTLLRALATDGLCNGAPISFNSHFEDRLGHMFKVVKAALEVQFGSFFKEALGATGLAAPKGKGSTSNAAT